MGGSNHVPILKLVTVPLSGVIKDYPNARVAYEHSVAKIPCDRRIVEVLLGANDSFELKTAIFSFKPITLAFKAPKWAPV